MDNDREFIENALHIKISMNGGNVDADANGSKETVQLGVLREDLIVLTKAERVAFTSVMSLLLVISLCGNVGTLRVNFRRKIRPFFRACLISLAVSDLINTIFLTTAYLSQISNEILQIWILGRAMCHLVPFITTAAILVSSITLVGIALDRYFAVMRAVISFWNPGVIFCMLSMLVLWASSMGISWPVFRVYELFPVYILTVQNMSMDDGLNSATTTNVDVDILEKVSANSVATATTNGRTIIPALHEAFSETVTKTTWERANTTNYNHSYTVVISAERVMMCISNQSSIATYYFIIFGIIFVPTIIALVCINSVIAKQLWKRRKIAVSVSKEHHSSYMKSWCGWCSCGICIRRSGKDELNPREKSNELKSSHNLNTLADTRIKIESSSVPTATSIQHFISSKTICPSPDKTNTSNSRESRHIRMFFIIITLITSFLFLRLPTWIFLLMSMNGSHVSHTWIILHYSFGILNITNSVLNPFFYTFLTETIKCAHFIKATLCERLCFFRLCQENNQEEVTIYSTGRHDTSQKGNILSDHSTTMRCGNHGIFKVEAVTPKNNPQRADSADEPKLSYGTGSNDTDDGADCQL